jgi:CheY-like chemotaxis protein
VIVDPPFSFRSLGFLVASRHEFTRELLHFALEAFQAEDILDAADGWDVLRTSAAFAPDVVLTEIDISPMGGAEVARRLREGSPRTSHAAVLVFAHRPLARDVLRAMEAGADDVLRLPFSARFLAQRIVGALVRRHPGMRLGDGIGHPSPPAPTCHSPEWPAAAKGAVVFHQEPILTPEEIRALTSGAPSLASA